MVLYPSSIQIERAKADLNRNLYEKIMSKIQQGTNRYNDHRYGHHDHRTDLKVRY
jgi:hypothetical protein